MPRSSKIGTVIDNRSVAATTWHRQRSRLEHTCFPRQDTPRHQIACTGVPLKRLAGILVRGLNEQIVTPVRKTFIARSLPMVVTRHIGRSASISRRRYGMVTPIGDSDNSKVRVMRLDGAPLEFEYPPMAASLIMEHPNHVVVHYCTNVRTRGQKYKIPKHKSNVTIVSGIKELVAGQTYFLLPIPAALKRGEKSTVTSYHGRMHRKSIDSGLAIGEAAPSILQVGRGRRKKIMLSVRTQGEVETILESAAGGKSAELQKIEPSSKFAAWTPALESIPESPQPKARSCGPSAIATTTSEAEILAYVQASIRSRFELVDFQ